MAKKNKVLATVTATFKCFSPEGAAEVAFNVCYQTKDLARTAYLEQMVDRISPLICSAIGMAARQQNINAESIRFSFKIIE